MLWSVLVPSRGNDSRTIAGREKEVLPQNNKNLQENPQAKKQDF